jgi:hypothetical protein
MKYTSDQITTLRIMVGQRRSAEEIAAVLGRSPSSIRMMCSRLDLSLTDHRVLLRVRVPPDVLVELKSEAAARQMPIETLARILLTVVAKDKIFEAVLDA